MVKQEAWEMVQAPVAGPGPDCGPECSVCGWGDGQDGYGLPHALHTCVRILKSEVQRAYEYRDGAHRDHLIATAAREYVAAVRADDEQQGALHDRLIAAVEGKL
jgi:hypothetical protein